jgi:hypothetical protein
MAIEHDDADSRRMSRDKGGRQYRFSTTGR